MPASPDDLVHRAVIALVVRGQFSDAVGLVRILDVIAIRRIHEHQIDGVIFERQLPRVRLFDIGVRARREPESKPRPFQPRVSWRRRASSRSRKTGRRPDRRASYIARRDSRSRTTASRRRSADRPAFPRRNAARDIPRAWSAVPEAAASRTVASIRVMNITRIWTAHGSLQEWLAQLSRAQRRRSFRTSS